MLERLAGLQPTDEVVGAAVVSACVALVVMGLLEYELGLPMSVSILVVPPIVATGYGLALWLHVTYSLAMLHSAAVLAVGMVALVLVYELVADPI